MNYHYIEYMVKERRKEEAEECKRLILLKRAGYSRTGHMERILVTISKKISLLKDRLGLMGRSSLRFFSHRNLQTRKRSRNA